MPPIEVKNEMTREINGGRSTLVDTPETGKVMFNQSTGSPPPFLKE
jgi:hypothetical protein